MLKERTKKQLLLPFFILQQLCDDKTDRASIRMNNYINAIRYRYSTEKIARILIHKKDCFYYDLVGLELKKEPRTENKEVLRKFYEEYLETKNKALQAKYSGYKVLLILYFYVSSIFEEYSAKHTTNDEEIKLLYSLQYLLNYALFYEQKERYRKLETEDDYESFQASAKKQSAKYFQKYYINL